jgi:hypothetical protein
MNIRIAGKALIFMDIIQDGHTLQAVCQAAKLGAFAGIPALEFQRFYHLVRRGDVVCKYATPLLRGLLLTEYSYLRHSVRYKSRRVIYQCHRVAYNPGSLLTKPSS